VVTVFDEFVATIAATNPLVSDEERNVEGLRQVA